MFHKISSTIRAGFTVVGAHVRICGGGPGQAGAGALFDRFGATHDRGGGVQIEFFSVYRLTPLSTT